MPTLQPAKKMDPSSSTPLEPQADPKVYIPKILALYSTFVVSLALPFPFCDRNLCKGMYLIMCKLKKSLHVQEHYTLTEASTPR